MNSPLPKCAAPSVASEPTLLQAEKICVEVRGYRVLHQISLRVEANEILMLIGPNGSGKSTLVRALLGLLPFQSGQLIRHPGLLVGYVPQGATWPSHIPMTARRFLLMHPRAHEEILLQTALNLALFSKHWLDRSAYTLSGGQKQRLLLARALLNQPNLLVLDEASCHLDLKAQTEIYQNLLHIRDSMHCALFLVSHDLHLVMAQADRIFCLNRTIQCSGPPKHLKANADFQKFFVQHGFAQALGFYGHSHPTPSVIDSVPNEMED